MLVSKVIKAKLHGTNHPYPLNYFVQVRPNEKCISRTIKGINCKTQKKYVYNIEVFMQD